MKERNVVEALRLIDKHRVLLDLRVGLRHRREQELDVVDVVR